MKNKVSNGIPLPNAWKKVKYEKFPDDMKVGHHFEPHLVEPDEDGCYLAPPDNSLRNKVYRYSREKDYKMAVRSVTIDAKSNNGNTYKKQCFRVWRVE